MTSISCPGRGEPVVVVVDRLHLDARIEDPRLSGRQRRGAQAGNRAYSGQGRTQEVFYVCFGSVSILSAKLRKGFEDLRKLYGQFGYIDFVAEPNIEPQVGTDKIDLTLNFDEGKQFFVRRIDFSGNTTTRDKVIRRELLIDEGDVFNTRLWELSILRLNQLGYFEALKAEDAADIKRDTRTNTVDITLKVKERGKNSIQLNGGVSGIAGSFLGFGYSTNNLVGLGETLSSAHHARYRAAECDAGLHRALFIRQAVAGRIYGVHARFDYDQGTRRLRFWRART